VRNLVLLLPSGYLAWRGGGILALDALRGGGGTPAGGPLDPDAAAR